MRKFLILAVTAAMALTSCSKEGAPGQLEEGTQAIEFRGVVEKTRASLTGTTAELTSFFVHAYQADDASDLTGVSALGFMNASVYTENPAAATRVWKYAPAKYWPVNGDFVSFYAYAPVKDVNMAVPTVADGVVSFGYTVPVAQNAGNTAVDLLVSAQLEKESAGASTPAVAFTFDHALSAVTFSAKNTNELAAGLVYEISAIEISKLDNTGTFTYDNTAAKVGSWTANTTFDKTYQAGVNASGIAVSPGGAGATAKNLLSDNDYMIVLPQTPTLGTFDVNGDVDVDGTFVEITFSLRDGEGNYIYDNFTRQLTLPTGFAFAMGARYNFTFSFGPGTGGGGGGIDELIPIVLDVTEVNDWAAPTTDPTPLGQ